MKRKILAGFLSLCMMVSLIPTTVFAEGTLPEAEVSNLGDITVGPQEGADYHADSYYVYDLVGGGGLSSSADKMDLQLAMEFVAKDSAEDAANNDYADYITDFFIEFDGLENGEFIGNGCYLAGYYPSFNAWVKIPLDGFKVEEGKVYSVITSAGFEFTYVDICTSVQDFICGIYISEDILDANPEIEINLELGLSKNMDEALAGTYKKVGGYPYEYSDLVDVSDCEAMVGDKYYPTLEAAVAKGGNVTLLKDVTLENVIEVRNEVTLDLNGKTITTGLKSEGRHHYAFDNYGTLTFAGEGTIEARGVENFGTMTFAEGSDIEVLSIDTNGGACVWNEGTLVVYGGTFKTATDTDSDSNDPGAIRNVGGTVTLNGGKYYGNSNWCYTVAADGGTTTIGDVVIEGVHGAIAAFNNAVVTVNGATAKCNGSGTGMSDHNIYVASGAEMTINGLTFEIDATVNEGDYLICVEDGTLVVKGGKYEGVDPKPYVAEGYVSVKDGDNYVVKAIDHEVVVEVPTVDENKTTTQTTVSEEAAKEVAEIGNSLVDAMKEAAKENDDTKITKVIEEAVADLNLEGQHHDDVVETLVEAVKNNEEVTITLTVSSVEAVPNSQEEAEIDAIKAKIEEEGQVLDENAVVLDITVTKTISVNGTDRASAELSEVEKPITHTIVFPEVPDVVPGMQRVWTMYSYHDGIVETYPVTDLGNGKGTFASSKYSYYVLAYEVVPVEQAEEHNWSDDFKMDGEYHWRYCKDCGIKKTRHAHVDVNKDGSCDACDYRATSTGRENPVTGVTADMLK